MDCFLDPASKVPNDLGFFQDYSRQGKPRPVSDGSSENPLFGHEQLASDLLWFWRKWEGVAPPTVRKPHSGSLTMPILVAKRRWDGLWPIRLIVQSFMALRCKSQEKPHRLPATAANPWQTLFAASIRHGIDVKETPNHAPKWGCQPIPC